MEGPTRLSRLAAAHGVATVHEAVPGQPAEVPRETVAAVLVALGIDPEADEIPGDPDDLDHGPLLPPTLVLRDGDQPPPLPPGTTLRLHTEDGVALPLPTGPAPLPLGYHTLHATAPDGRTAEATLIVVPPRLPAPPGRAFGLLVQLYSLLSERSWGMGDLVDLGDLASWAGHTHGAGFVQVNPLHAAVPGGPGQPTDPSPYRPATRRYPDPVHLRIEDIPEYAYLDADARHHIDQLLARAAELRADVLHRGAHIDRDAVWDLKRQALETLRAAVPLGPGRRAAYCAFLAAEGEALEDHATWCALAEAHGPDWRGWPAGLRDPRSPATARARAELLERIDFHSWLAWLTDTQLARAQRAARAAGMPIGLVHDLALGVHPHGSDAWAQAPILAAGVSAGAPPDAFNTRGQDWGLPPWRPDRLAEHGYEPYRQLLAGVLRHAGGVRIDHVMSQFRLWWIPEGADPADGTYVSYDANAMLGVLALEAHRAGAVVIGEDLGTVAPGVREELAARGIAGTSVLWFERDWAAPGAPPLPPEAWRADCLATVTTHDLPPTAARLAADHVRLRDLLDITDDAEGELRDAHAENAEWLAYFDRLGLLPPDAGEPEVIAAAYRFLARTPARMVGVWLPDATGDRRPQNVPGTWREYPNWRLPIADADGRPTTLEALAASPRVVALLDALRAEMAGP
ncbi:4-alpha-glucanotransferase [Streptomyces millisiae]|uniref:4-alpha-glucanotransferase n=1 Tax=Streptomyces millisiae TaxID=3075542 RepID=A0ABU2LSH7_9ACTN|nr:4-alpha-glucanotransferase [Streptomyces sp. DSM 44918]MDT0320480.1 4-alpha-glucanotransferase [Streptomyces sp. DSM 44918]